MRFLSVLGSIASRGEMLRFRFILLLLLACAAVPNVHAQRAESQYKSGVRAESKGNLDAAYEAYKLAHEKKPGEPKYLAAFLKARLNASTKHIQDGQTLRDTYKLQEALAEFQRAAEIDSSNYAALQEIRRTTDLIEKKERRDEQQPAMRAESSSLERAAALAAEPVSLTLATEQPISLHLFANTDVVYKTLGKLAGINVLMDPEYKPQKINVELQYVSLREALAMVALQSKTFWRPVSANSILVTSDGGGRKKEIEQVVMRTFYLRNATTPADLQQAASTLKGILDINRIQITPEQRALTIRGTPDQMVLAQRLLEDIDKPRAEVMIDIAVLEVSRGRIRTLGVVPPTSFTASVQPATTGAAGSTAGFSLQSLSTLTANDILVTIPSVSLTALMSDSNTKVLQKPQIRAMDSERASLKIGDRIPVATGSFQSGLTNGVNTQFTYIDVGVNVDITPYVHANREVTLKMSFEISSVTGEQTISGVTEPTIGQRKIEHEVRLSDGEVNLIGGILQDTEAHSLSGYPLLAKIPILKYLFGQENKDHQESEIVFAVTPHIIRSNEINDQNLRLVDIGTGNEVTYRAAESVPVPLKPNVPLKQGVPPAKEEKPMP
jgi:general secretion pathway protein D